MTRLKLLLVVSLVAVSSGFGAEPPGALRFEPVTVGAGPLLFFVHPEDREGRSQPGGGARAEVLYVLDPATSRKPVPIWRGGNPRVIPLERVSEQLVLVEFEWRGHLVNLATGSVTPLLEGTDQTELIAVEKTNIFFRRRTVPYEFRGMSLKSGKDGKTVVEGYYRPRDLLYCHVVGEGDPSKPVSPIVVEKLLATDADGFWVITADKPQKLMKIARDGGAEEIIAVDPDWVVADTAHAFSPGKDYLALSVLKREQDFHTERALVVCDLKKKEVCFADPSAPISQFRSYPPPLELDWHDDSVLSYGGFLQGHRWVDVKRRAKLDEAAVKKFAPGSFEPPTPKREKRGHFELEFGLVYFPGEKKPIASVLDDRGVGVNDLAVTEDGSFAAYCDPKGKNVYLIDGVTRKKTRIISGWSYGLVWK